MYPTLLVCRDPVLKKKMMHVAWPERLARQPGVVCCVAIHAYQYANAAVQQAGARCLDTVRGE